MIELIVALLLTSLGYWMGRYHQQQIDAPAVNKFYRELIDDIKRQTNRHI